MHNQTVPMENLLDRSEADVRGVKRSPGRSSSQHVQGHGQGYGHTVMAGEANKKGGIFDRLTNENSYTGVCTYNVSLLNCMRHRDAICCLFLTCAIFIGCCRRTETVYSTRTHMLVRITTILANLSVVARRSKLWREEYYFMSYYHDNIVIYVSSINEYFKSYIYVM